MNNDNDNFDKDSFASLLKSLMPKLGKNGYTLVELIIVVAIIGIILMISFGFGGVTEEDEAICYKYCNNSSDYIITFVSFDDDVSQKTCQCTVADKQHLYLN